MKREIVKEKSMGTSRCFYRRRHSFPPPKLPVLGASRVNAIESQRCCCLSPNIATLHQPLRSSDPRRHLGRYVLINQLLLCHPQFLSPYLTICGFLVHIFRGGYWSTFKPIHPSARTLLLPHKPSQSIHHKNWHLLCLSSISIKKKHD